MDSTIVFNTVQILDIFCRFSATGVLTTLLLALLNRPSDAINRFTSGSLIVCLIAYVLLTAPIDNHAYGWLRPPLLLLTDLTCYSIFAVYWQRVRGKPLWSACAVWGRVLAIVWFSWLSYFFLVKKGIGPFHTLHHGIALVMLLVILADALQGFNDDLVESRRDTRKVVIWVISLYMTALTAIELFAKPLKDDALFSVFNASLILLLSLAYTVRWIAKSGEKQQLNLSQQRETSSLVETNRPNEVAKLHTLMNEGFYTRNGLTIRVMAEALNLPEHQLRALINRELGFENFSQFLNSYRIPAVAERLKNIRDKDTPILTIALESGYNSIAPFNRAFKELKGTTPSAFRKQHLADFQNC